jgi:hypothetical protein
LEKAKEESPYWVEDSILDYLNYHKDRVIKTKEIAAGTLHNLYAPIATFCKRHKQSGLPPIDWDMLAESLPTAKTAASDRAPTVKEIHKLVEYPDRRIKPLVYVSCSSGIRLGAWEYLRWKHVIPKFNEKGEIITAKLIVYAGEPEEHFTFITPEAYNALKDYLDVRALHGENITGDSLLIRDEWRDSDIKMGPGGNYSLATYPQKDRK